MRVHVQHQIDELVDDMTTIERRFRPQMAKVVKKAAKRGNDAAKGFASEQHTMHSDVDIDYAPSFTTERRGDMEWEYGPDSALPQGSKASGYEFGSINQASPHQNLDRSVDILAVEFPKAIGDELGDLFQRAGFR
ncbi:hypothetical protein [Pimelobacter simplex]|uniref:hypothetical protein n=1 Tax=Nocardioides simplex TaxID=2045 RepID=UPI003AAB2AEC